MEYLLLELRPYMIDVNDDLYEMLQEIPYKDEFDQTNEFYGKTKQQIKDEINAKMKIAYSLNLSRNVLPNETYVLYVDGKPVCMGGLRLRLNNYWKKHSGNIWYKTRPSHRRKGYATILAKLICERAKDLGMSELVAQCDVNNVGSNKVLQNNGFKTYPLCPDWDDTNFYKKKL